MIISIFLAADVTSVAHAEEVDSEIVIEASSGRVLYEKNADTRRYIASLTKIMSAIISIENSDISREIVVPAKCCGIEGSSIYLQPNERLTIEQLLYGLMLRSGNDCAETLAVAISGSVENFAELMNKKAAELGASNTHFVNPHGLYDGENYSTAKDMAIITAYAMRDQTFRKIVSTKSIVIPNTVTGQNRYLKNKNKLLFNYEDCIGVKTGYTKKAGRCLASAAKSNDMELISVVLGCGPMYEVSQNNFEKAFSEYKMVDICNEKEFEYTADFGGTNCAVGNITKGFRYPLKESEINKIEKVVEIDETIILPLKKGDKIGNLKIYLENQLLFSSEIYTIIDVGKKFDITEPIKNWNVGE